MMEVVNFLKWVVTSDKLEIAQYFKQMTDQSFFLVAATGLGKTVGVPVHVLIRQVIRCGAQLNPTPRVWVVEPRIPIAVDQCMYMNSLWDEYSLTVSRNKRKTAPLFGQITSLGRRNPAAPIQFVTTGIFEVFARNGEFDPVNDRIIIDEAHVTVEQNPGVELGTALCRKAGVTIDYMSATVDVTTLQEDLGVDSIIRADKQRSVIWKSNLLQPIIETIDDLLLNTLIKPDTSSRYYPSSEFSDASRVIESATKSGRSHGMLIVVNSFSGSTSDIRKLADKVRRSFPELPVLQLAGDVIRDHRKEKAFKDTLRDIERRHANYVILSTSVVEMGITFPTLDYVVTMDSGYDQETVGDIAFPVVKPLGVNSLLQRIGRVGRRNPGIAYISNEVDAPYSSLEDRALNAGSLAYEPIRFPLSTSSLMSLAYYGASEEVDDYDTWLKDLNLPSRIQESQERMDHFVEQLDRLEELGIMSDERLTDLGVLMRDWIGRVDIAYAVKLQKRFARGASREEILFWICATALSNNPTKGFSPQYGYFIDYGGSREDTAYRLSLWPSAPHEDIALFAVFCETAGLLPGFLWDRARQTSSDMAMFNAWCNWSGVNGQRVIKAAKALSDAVVLFAKINGESERFTEIFEDRDTLNPALIDWKYVYSTLNLEKAAKHLRVLSGMVTVELTSHEGSAIFSWKDCEHDREGVISQDDTPIRLDDEYMYMARIVPSRENATSDVSWRLNGIAAGILPDYSSEQIEPVEDSVLIEPVAIPVIGVSVPVEQTPAPLKPRKKGFFERLFGR